MFCSRFSGKKKLDTSMGFQYKALTTVQIGMTCTITKLLAQLSPTTTEGKIKKESFPSKYLKKNYKDIIIDQNFVYGGNRLSQILHLLFHFQSDLAEFGSYYLIYSVFVKKLFKLQFLRRQGGMLFFTRNRFLIRF